MCWLRSSVDEGKRLLPAFSVVTVTSHGNGHLHRTTVATVPHLLRWLCAYTVALFNIIVGTATATIPLHHRALLSVLEECNALLARYIRRVYRSVVERVQNYARNR